MLREFVKYAASRFGYKIVNESNEPILRDMLRIYDDLRLHPMDLLRWDHTLSALTSASHLRTLLKFTKPDLLVDVGANRGQFAKASRRSGFKGRILSFEPQSALLEQLKQDAEADGNWSVFPCGLGSMTETLELQIFKDDTFSSVLPLSESAERKFGEMVSVSRSERIEVRRLDDVMAEAAHDAGETVFLKSDTQGNDLSVLQGATETLDRAVGVLVEASVDPLYVGASAFHQLNDFLLSRGFCQAGLFPIGYERSRHTLIELDCFYLRET